jgi:hypothetical protein
MKTVDKKGNAILLYRFGNRYPLAVLPPALHRSVAGQAVNRFLETAEWCRVLRLPLPLFFRLNWNSHSTEFLGYLFVIRFCLN